MLALISVPVGGGVSHMKVTGMLVGNFEHEAPKLKETNLGVAQASFGP